MSRVRYQYNNHGVVHAENEAPPLRLRHHTREDDIYVYGLNKYLNSIYLNAT